MFGNLLRDAIGQPQEGLDTQAYEQQPFPQATPFAGGVYGMRPQMPQRQVRYDMFGQSNTLPYRNFGGF